MAGPWEKYSKKDGPWSRYSKSAPEAPADDRPWYEKAGQAADDMVRLAANGATFGLADKLAGYMGGDGTDAEREKTAAAKERAGNAGTVAELAGAVAMPMGMASQGATLAGRLGTGAMTGAKGLAARTGLMAAEGAAYGATDAAVNDRNILEGAGVGAIAGGVGNVAGEAISKGVSTVAGAFNKKPATISPEDLTKLKDAAYDRAEKAGVMFGGDVTTSLRDRVASELADFGYHPKLQPGVAALMDELDGLAGQNVTLKGLDTVRKMAGNAYIPGNKANNTLASKITSAIDDIIDSAPAMTGDSAAGASALREARDYASRSFKLDKINNAVDTAERRAASTGSGGNVNNATRQNLRRVFEKGRNWTPDEASAMETAIRGTPGQNALRLAGKLSPSGNGLMAALGVGGAMVNPAIGALSLGGMGAKALADRGTTENIRKVTEAVLRGGLKVPPAKNAVQRLAESKRDALVRALMAIGIHGAP